ncbi:anthocyanidin 3-O-glucosyltransferase 7 [Cicer arietinum]|uniref:Glycosyltransferase n=1 Tax=Cicer arietinum TaxID=3827 RepID=A0A067XTV5_CICAR|nr:anthocyanidin 3-O-glucosyltransferase 7 [Cicer arietinum]AGU14062.1 UDP-glycosyltransferase [Cicer arietinum]
MTISSDHIKHVAVYVFPFGSHPVPLLNLVLKLAHASPNTLFSFIGTQQSNKPLFSKPNIPNNIKPFSIDDGVPKGHVLGSNPTEKLNLFLQAGHQNLQKGIDLAVAYTKQRVTCIISDAFVVPSFFLAQKLNVPWIPIWPPLSCSLSAHFYTDLIRQNIAENNEKDRVLDILPGLSNMRVGDLPQDVTDGGEDEPLFSKTLALLGKVLPQAKAVVMNFFEELDPPLFVEDMRSKLKCLLYVGFLTFSLPLPPLPPSESDETGCLSWLDKQKDRSVVYVSFGTVVTPPPNELIAVAEALEESGFPFLWSLKDHLKGLLPNGFLERTSDCGKIVSWAPQAQVLGHDSVGVFVTHCGCNSVFESISNGVPMICRPFFGDHGMTGRMVEDVWEIGMRIEGGVFTKNGLVKSLNQILVREEGNKMREKAQKVKRTVLDAAGPQGKAAQDFKTLVELVSSS